MECMCGTPGVGRYIAEELRAQLKQMSKSSMSSIMDIFPGSAVHWPLKFNEVLTEQCQPVGVPSCREGPRAGGSSAVVVRQGEQVEVPDHLEHCPKA